MFKKLVDDVFREYEYCGSGYRYNKEYNVSVNLLTNATEPNFKWIIEYDEVFLNRVKVRTVKTGYCYHGEKDKAIKEISEFLTTITNK